MLQRGQTFRTSSHLMRHLRTEAEAAKAQGGGGTHGRALAPQKVSPGEASRRVWARPRRKPPLPAGSRDPALCPPLRKLRAFQQQRGQTRSQASVHVGAEPGAAQQGGRRRLQVLSGCPVEGARSSRGSLLVPKGRPSHRSGPGSSARHLTATLGVRLCPRPRRGREGRRKGLGAELNGWYAGSLRCCLKRRRALAGRSWVQPLHVIRCAWLGNRHWPASPCSPQLGGGQRAQQKKRPAAPQPSFCPHFGTRGRQLHNRGPDRQAWHSLSVEGVFAGADPQLIFGLELLQTNSTDLENREQKGEKRQPPNGLPLCGTRGDRRRREKPAGRFCC